MKIPIDDIREVIDGLSPVPLLTGWANAAGDSSQYIRITHSKKSLSFALTGTLWAGGMLTVTESGDWRFFIDRRVLTAFLKTASGTEVDLQCDGKQMILKAGHKLTLSNHDDIGGYSMWQAKAVTKLPDAYIEALPMLLHYCPTLSGMSHVDAIVVAKGFGILATDTVSMAALSDTGAKHDYFLPHSLMEIYKDNNGKLSVEPDGVGIEFQNSFTYQPLHSGLSNYPLDKITNVLKQGAAAKPVGVLDSVKLQALLETLSAMAVADKSDKAIASTRTSQKLDSLIFTVDLPGGQVTRSISIDGCKAELKPVAWVMRKFLPWVEHVGKQNPEITFKRLTAATVLTAGDFTFMMSDL